MVSKPNDEMSWPCCASCTFPRIPRRKTFLSRAAETESWALGSIWSGHSELFWTNCFLLCQTLKTENISSIKFSPVDKFHQNVTAKTMAGSNLIGYNHSPKLLEREPTHRRFHQCSHLFSASGKKTKEEEEEIIFRIGMYAYRNLRTNYLYEFLIKSFWAHSSCVNRSWILANLLNKLERRIDC